MQADVDLSGPDRRSLFETNARSEAHAEAVWCSLGMS